MGLPTACTLRVFPVYSSTPLAAQLEHTKLPVENCTRWDGGGMAVEEEEEE
jgi:hypothetical protein